MKNVNAHECSIKSEAAAGLALNGTIMFETRGHRHDLQAAGAQIHKEPNFGWPG